MSYNILKFNCTRGSVFGSATILNNTNHFYTSSGDTLATILTGGYFPANFGFNVGQVAAKDTVYIKGSDTEGLISIIDPSVPSFNIMANPVSPIASITMPTQSVTFSGIWAAPQPVTLQYIRTVYVGGIVETMLIIPFVRATATINDIVIMSAPPIYYPLWNAAALQVIPIYAQDNALFKAGEIFIDNSDLNISLQNGALFTGAGDSGWPVISIRYPSN